MRESSAFGRPCDPLDHIQGDYPDEQPAQEPIHLGDDLTLEPLPTKTSSSS